MDEQMIYLIVAGSVSFVGGTIMGIINHRKQKRAKEREKGNDIKLDKVVEVVAANEKFLTGKQKQKLNKLKKRIQQIEAAIGTTQNILQGRSQRKSSLMLEKQSQLKPLSTIHNEEVELQIEDNNSSMEMDQESLVAQAQEIKTVKEALKTFDTQ